MRENQDLPIIINSTSAQERLQKCYNSGVLMESQSKDKDLHTKSQVLILSYYDNKGRLFQT